MVSIEFSYNQGITSIQAKESEQFNEVIERYYQKAMIPKDSVYFLVSGTLINPERTVGSYMSGNLAGLKVLVNPIYNEIETKVQESKDIICPECKEPCRIKLDDYHIKLFECANGHEVNGIKIQEFNKTQEINVSSIKCDQCKIKNKGNSGEFFYCSTCKKNLCLICKPNHDYNHIPMKFDKKKLCMS